jgi:hypothetical protein
VGLELIENVTRFDFQGQVTYTNLPGGGACVTIAFPLAS